MDRHPAFAVTVDLVVLTIRGGKLRVLLVRRGAPPHLGQWALPGGFVHPQEGLAAAAARELREETGISGHLEQLASYGEPGRDPRGRVVSIAYLVLVPAAPPPVAGTDAAAAGWHPVAGRPDPLAFDHELILADGVERARAKLEYTPLGAAFCADAFTIADLRAVYEAVWDTPLDPRNFHRKATTTRGFVQPTGALTEGDRGRPARLYRRGSATTLYPPLLRPAG
jgi:ADP-ribose pyrophosphatase YjhB (NUDIX family)